MIHQRPQTQRALVKRRLRRKLAQLGNTVDEWRQTLEKKGVKGVTGDQHSCVLAVYLSDKNNSVEVTGLGGIDTDTPPIMIHPEDGPGYGYHPKCANTLDTFIDLFDSDAFPNLVEEEELA